MMNNAHQEGNTVRNFLKLTVSLNVLEEACLRLSGMAHTYSVEASRNRVYLTYSNPDEYGSESPMIAVLPAWQESWPENHTVVCCEILRVKNDNWNGEGWQAFDPLFDLARCLLPLVGGPTDGGWSELSEDVAKEYHRSQAGFSSQGMEAVFAQAKQEGKGIDWIEEEAERRGLYLRDVEYWRRRKDEG